MTPFFQITLRTNDVAAARAFYGALLGSAPLDIVQLHEQAVARGARPHWLGFIDVGDVDRAAAGFVESGAVPLAPKWVNPQGLEAAVMRDPGGAIVALAKPAPGAEPNWSARVGSQVLHTADVQRARQNYAELFGWDFQPTFAVENLGEVHPFAYAPGEPVAGAMVDIGARPGLHPHWLFHFRVPDVAAAMEVVRTSGGSVLGPFSLRNGATVAVCDDPQGAAFALQQGDINP